MFLLWRYGWGRKNVVINCIQLLPLRGNFESLYHLLWLTEEILLLEITMPPREFSPISNDVSPSTTVADDWQNTWLLIFLHFPVVSGLARTVAGTRCQQSERKIMWHPIKWVACCPSLCTASGWLQSMSWDEVHRPRSRITSWRCEKVSPSPRQSIFYGRWAWQGNILKPVY